MPAFSIEEFASLISNAFDGGQTLDMALTELNGAHLDLAFCSANYPSLFSTATTSTAVAEQHKAAKDPRHSMSSTVELGPTCLGRHPSKPTPQEQPKKPLALLSKIRRQLSKAGGPSKVTNMPPGPRTAPNLPTVTFAPDPDFRSATSFDGTETSSLSSVPTPDGSQTRTQRNRAGSSAASASLLSSPSAYSCPSYAGSTPSFLDSERRPSMEPYDNDIHASRESYSTTRHNPGPETRSILSANHSLLSEESDYIPFLPLVVQHERAVRHLPLPTPVPLNVSHSSSLADATNLTLPKGSGITAASVSGSVSVTTLGIPPPPPSLSRKSSLASTKLTPTSSHHHHTKAVSSRKSSGNLSAVSRSSSRKIRHGSGNTPSNINNGNLSHSSESQVSPLPSPGLHHMRSVPVLTSTPRHGSRRRRGGAESSTDLKANIPPSPSSSTDTRSPITPSSPLFVVEKRKTVTSSDLDTSSSSFGELIPPSSSKLRNRHDTSHSSRSKRDDGSASVITSITSPSTSPTPYDSSSSQGGSTGIKKTRSIHSAPRLPPPSGPLPHLPATNQSQQRLTSSPKGSDSEHQDHLRPSHPTSRADRSLSVSSVSSSSSNSYIKKDRHRHHHHQVDVESRWAGQERDDQHHLSPQPSSEWGPHHRHPSPLMHMRDTASFSSLRPGSAVSQSNASSKAVEMEAKEANVSVDSAGSDGMTSGDVALEKEMQKKASTSKTLKPSSAAPTSLRVSRSSSAMVSLAKADSDLEWTLKLGSPTERERERTMSGLGKGKVPGLGGESRVVATLAPNSPSQEKEQDDELVESTPVLVPEQDTELHSEAGMPLPVPSSPPFSRLRTQSESALRALSSSGPTTTMTPSLATIPAHDVLSSVSSSTAPSDPVPDAGASAKRRGIGSDWTLSLPLPSARNQERSRKVSDVGTGKGGSKAWLDDPAVKKALKDASGEGKKEKGDRTSGVVICVEDADVESARRERVVVDLNADDDSSRGSHEDEEEGESVLGHGGPLRVPRIVADMSALSRSSTRSSGHSLSTISTYSDAADSKPHMPSERPTSLITITGVDEEGVDAILDATMMNQEHDRIQENLAKLAALDQDLANFNALLKSASAEAAVPPRKRASSTVGPSMKHAKSCGFFDYHAGRSAPIPAPIVIKPRVSKMKEDVVLAEQELIIEEEVLPPFDTSFPSPSNAVMRTPSSDVVYEVVAFPPSPPITRPRSQSSVTIMTMATTDSILTDETIPSASCALPEIESGVDADDMVLPKPLSHPIANYATCLPSPPSSPPHTPPSTVTQAMLTRGSSSGNPKIRPPLPFSPFPSLPAGTRTSHPPTYVAGSVTGFCPSAAVAFPRAAPGYRTMSVVVSPAVPTNISTSVNSSMVVPSGAPAAVADADKGNRVRSASSVPLFRPPIANNTTPPRGAGTTSGKDQPSLRVVTSSSPTTPMSTVTTSSPPTMPPPSVDHNAIITIVSSASPVQTPVRTRPPSLNRSPSKNLTVNTRLSDDDYRSSFISMSSSNASLTPTMPTSPAYHDDSAMPTPLASSFPAPPPLILSEESLAAVRDSLEAEATNRFLGYGPPPPRTAGSIASARTSSSGSTVVPRPRTAGSSYSTSSSAPRTSEERVRSIRMRELGDNESGIEFDESGESTPPTPIPGLEAVPAFVQHAVQNQSEGASDKRSSLNGSNGSPRRPPSSASHMEVDSLCSGSYYSARSSFSEWQ